MVGLSGIVRLIRLVTISPGSSSSNRTTPIGKIHLRSEPWTQTGYAIHTLRIARLKRRTSPVLIWETTPEWFTATAHFLIRPCTATGKTQVLGAPGNGRSTTTLSLGRAAAVDQRRLMAIPTHGHIL